ncbi:MAG: histidinol-phosphate transaminase [Candidatus Acidiferrales bacterium]|jgi:histidinol-phosphate aminotransferase
MRTQPLSRRQFAVGLGAAIATVARPSFARASFAPLILQRPARPEGAIRLDANENPYGPSPKAIAAITGSETIAMRYPDDAYASIRGEIAQLHKVAPEQVILGCGSSEILRIADMATLTADGNVVAAEPTFEAVLRYARATRAKPIKVPLTSDFRHDLPQMAAQCTSRTGLVYLCNPNNPTGTIVTRDEMSRFFGDVPKSTMILVDEAYFHFADHPRYASATEWLDKIPNLVVARTFSKVYGLAGMRLGYAVGSKDTIDAMAAHLLADSCNAAVLAAGRASLADQDRVAECRARILSTRSRVTAQLKSKGFHVLESQANFFMVDTGSDVRPTIDEFRRRGILVGRRFPSMANWLRVTIGTDDEMHAFSSAFDQILCSNKPCVSPS